MIYLYPANKTENLLALVNKIQHISPLSVFEKEVIIVQNAGMQHWLNMSLAQSRGICLNIDYALPAQFLWKLLRTILNNGDDIDQKPFSREAMCWRIFELLASSEVVFDDDFAEVTQYWSNKNTNVSGLSSSSTYSTQENLKRYQLSCQLADLFEQYLIFRPNWVNIWYKKQVISDINLNESFANKEKWQAKLWQMLTSEQEYNPLKFIELAAKKLPEVSHLLPKRLSCFGLNAMAPMWLSFIHEMSKVTEVHFFHLNPCFDYWGDIVTEKQAFKRLNAWTDNYQAINESVGNPLLANLGQQGREFLVLLQQYTTFNIDAFEEAYENSTVKPSTVLADIQNQMLALVDGRDAPIPKVDDSIVITSAHSALREVQGLHDWLLHQVNNDKTLTPKDILVMCPQVEQYAPYINAVFARGWHDAANDIPPLPCSIADRVSKDSEPLVAAFIELVALPDSRFHVSQIVSWLRLSAVQMKFDISLEEIDKMSGWIEAASIHWGIDQTHKQQVLQCQTASEQFTWRYGLARLLQGFAYSDQANLYHDKLVLPDVEGNDSLLLGKLCLIIEHLQYFNFQLAKPRTPTQWHQFLLELLDNLFDLSQEDSFTTIIQAIESLVEYTEQANFEHLIELGIVREFLDNHFSQPDPGRQFMIGQVTFCSMLPMRSIPFKVVAILGLNDGEFPRQRTPLAFDLMAMSPFQLGDRSRRGDDRYLFLEAIISARQNLYLSYQGRNIKNNKEKQPSIVLKELIDYLSQSFHWQILTGTQENLRQLPMQPYSEKNYIGDYPSFDSKWLFFSEKLKNSKSIKAGDITKSAEIQSLVIETESSQKIKLEATQLIRFYQHPSRYFAQQTLSLYLDNQLESLNDDEPFDCNHLTSYVFKQQVLDVLLSSKLLTPDKQGNVENLLGDVKKAAKVSGKFPDLPHNEELINKLASDSEKLADYMSVCEIECVQTYDLTIKLPIKADQKINDQVGKQTDNIVTSECQLTVRIQVANDKLINYRTSQPKSKDFVQQYLHLLVLQLWLEQHSISTDNEIYHHLSKVTASHGFYFDTKAQKAVHYVYDFQQNVINSLALLIEYFLIGQKQALLLNGDLAEKYYKTKGFDQQEFELYWYDANNDFSLGKDPYIHYFWPAPPLFAEILPAIEQIFASIVSERTKVKVL